MASSLNYFATGPVSCQQVHWMTDDMREADKMEGLDQALQELELNLKQLNGGIEDQNGETTG